MALNNLGLGFVFSAQNLGAATFKAVQRDLQGVAAESEATALVVDRSMRNIKAGALLAGAGAAGLAFLNVATNEAAMFGSAIAEVSTLIDEATFSTDEMRKVTKSAAAEFGGPAIGQAQALYQIISAGASDAAAATDLLTQSNKLAVGGITEVSIAADVLTSAVNVYAAQGLTAADATDSLFVAIKAGKTTAAELANSLGAVLPTAKSLRVSFDEVNAAIAAMTANGLATSRAVTGLNAAFANIKKPTKSAQEEAARLGVKFNESALRAKGFQGFLESIIGSSKFTEESFTKLFGSVEAGNAVVSLTSNNMEKFNETLDAMAAKSGATNAAFEKMSNTLAFQEKRFDTLTNTALIAIGEAIEPMKKSIIEVANAFLEGFNALSPGFRDFIVQAFAIASTIAFVAGGALLLKGSLGLLGVTIGGLLGIVASAVASMLPLILIFGGIAAAIGLFVVAFQRDIGGIGTFFRNVFARIKLFFQAMVQLFSEGGFSGAVGKELNKAGNEGVKGFAITVFLWFNRIKNLFGSVVDGFTAGIEAARPAFASLLEGLQLIGQALGFISIGPGNPTDNARAFEAFGLTGLAVGQIFADLAVLFVTVLAKSLRVVAFVINAVRVAWGELIEFIAPGVNVIIGLMALLAAFVEGDFSTAWQGMKILVFSIIQSLIGALTFFARNAAKIVDGIADIFGKDLGAADAIRALQKEVEATVAKGLKVEGDIRGPAGEGAPRSPRRLEPIQSPAVAQVIATTREGGQPGINTAEIVKAIKEAQGEGRPQMITLEVDGEAIAQASSRGQKSLAGRSFAPVPTT